MASPFWIFQSFPVHVQQPHFRENTSILFAFSRNYGFDRKLPAHYFPAPPHLSPQRWKITRPEQRVGRFERHSHRVRRTTTRIHSFVALPKFFLSFLRIVSRVSIFSYPSYSSLALIFTSSKHISRTNSSFSIRTHPNPPALSPPLRSTTGGVCFKGGPIRRGIMSLPTMGVYLSVGRIS